MIVRNLDDCKSAISQKSRLSKGVLLSVGPEGQISSSIYLSMRTFESEARLCCNMHPKVDLVMTMVVK